VADMSQVFVFLPDELFVRSLISLLGITY